MLFLISRLKVFQIIAFLYNYSNNNFFPTLRSTIHSRLGQCRYRLDDHLYRCVLGDNLYSLRFYKKFLRMTVKKREDIVERHRYCINYLGKSHDLRECKSMNTCKKCDRFHHMLLHKKPISPGNLEVRRAKLHVNGRNQQPRRSNNQNHQQHSNISKSTDAKILMVARCSIAHVLCDNTDNSVD